MNSVAVGGYGWVWFSYVFWVGKEKNSLDFSSLLQNNSYCKNFAMLILVTYILKMPQILSGCSSFCKQNQLLGSERWLEGTEAVTATGGGWGVSE